METEKSIEQIYQEPINRKTKAQSYHDQSFAKNYKKIRAAGKTTTNCYIKIECNHDSQNIIECSPIQTFYCVDSKIWIPAYQLDEGDLLFSEHPNNTLVSKVTFIEKPFELYTLEIKKFHTFLVGKDKILTHNMALAPCAFLSLGLAFGEGVTIAAPLASYLGPLALGAGISFGGIIGIVGNYVSQANKKFDYQVNFNPVQLMARGKDSNKQKSDKKSSNGGDNNSTDPDKDPDNDRNKKDSDYTNNKQDREDAKKLEYKEGKPPFNTHGKLAFKKGNFWITADRDGHNGGRWKMFNKNWDRIGTFDKYLNRIR